ncbi:hypothetical protein EDB86DRAFT_3241744 [Lactarius hatsudake]|nr:hypothetical protein EDB86DRAFT_3241744 [Lactarius hatsudake]
MAARSSRQLPLTRHITRDCDGLLGGYKEDRSGECALKRHSLPMGEFPLYAARSGRYRLTDIDHLSESGCDLSASVLRCLSRVRWGVGSFSCPLSAFFGPRLNIRRLMSSLRGAMRPVTHVTAASTIFCRLSPHLGRLRQISLWVLRPLQKVDHGFAYCGEQLAKIGKLGTNALVVAGHTITTSMMSGLVSRQRSGITSDSQHSVMVRRPIGSVCARD